MGIVEEGVIACIQAQKQNEVTGHRSLGTEKVTRFILSKSCEFWEELGGGGI